MRNDKYSFHLSARLYARGITPKSLINLGGTKYTMENVDSAASAAAVAPIIQGYISWNNENKVAAGSLDNDKTGGGAFSFANARALEKRASSNPTLMMKVMNLITLYYVYKMPKISPGLSQLFFQRQSL